MSFSLKTSKGIPLFVEILFLASPGLRATDCNQNGVKDTLDIASGTSRDCNLNSLPDECDVTPTFKLGAAESFPIERSPDVLTAADMDGDSDLDLVTLSVGVYDGHDIAILFNNGDHTFSQPLTLVVGFIVSPGASMAPGDFDGDGDMDLVASLRELKSVGVLLNGGKGALSRATVFSAGGDPRSMSAGDFDKDGDLDLAIALGTNKAAVLLNNGSASFELPVFYATGEGASVVASGDFQGNGRLDLATANESGTVSVLLNTGSGAFGAPLGFDTPFGRPKSLLTGDLDGDGDTDLLEADRELDRIGVFFNEGGTFAEGQMFRLDWAPSNVLSSAQLGDLDGDGDLDLAVSREAVFGSVSFFLNNGRGEFQQSGDFLAGVDASSLILGDLDGDRDLDLAVTNLGPDAISVVWNKGNGTWGLPREISAGESSGAVAVGDLDGDGSMDLAVANYEHASVSVLLNEGQAAFGTAKPTPAGPAPRSIACTDLDQDGDLDLVLVSPTPFTFSTSSSSLGSLLPAWTPEMRTTRTVDISDGIFILNFLFLGGATPPDPGGPSSPCGIDGDGSLDGLGCEAYEHC